MRHEDGHVASGREVLRVRQSVGVRIARSGHAEARGMLVHQLDERFLRASHVLREGDACVVAGLHDDPLEEVLHGHLAPDLDEHLRAAHLPRLAAYRDQLVELEISCCELREGGVRGHQLDQARRLHAAVGVLLRENPSGMQVLQDPGLGLELHRSPGGRRVLGGGGGQDRKSKGAGRCRPPPSAGAPPCRLPAVPLFTHCRSLPSPRPEFR